MKYTLDQQIAELARDSTPWSVYPRFIKSGKMSKEEADEHLAKLCAAISTLEWCRQYEEALKTL